MRGDTHRLHRTQEVMGSVKMESNHQPLILQALVYEHPGQELEIELFDEDPDKDDFLGRYIFVTGQSVALLFVIAS